MRTYSCFALLTACFLPACTSEPQAHYVPHEITSVEKEIGQASADFGVNLYLEAVKKNEAQNICISPWSAYSALAMLSLGAKGETASEFAQVLKVKQDAGGANARAASRRI